MSSINRIILKSVCTLLACSIGIFSTSCEKEQSDGKGYLFNYTMTSNPQNLDPQIATDSNSITVIKNTFTGLMTEDETGNITFGVAKDYTVSDDGLRYVFYLRDDYKWFTSSGATLDVTSYDFVFAFYRMFNRETYSPYREMFSCLKNATNIINNEHEYSYTDIGVYASDKYTITFLLDYPNADFLRLLTQSYAMPCNEEFFNSTHSTYGLYDYSTISNGPFYIKQWFYDSYGKDNFLTLRKNPINPNYDDYSPYAVQFTIDEKTDLSEIQHAFYKDETDLYYSSSIDKSSIDKEDIIYSYEISTVGAIFNLDDSQFSNQNLRNAFAYSIDREEAIKKSSTDIMVAYGIVPTACKVSGKNYRNIVPDTSLIDASYSLNNAISEFQTAKDTLGEISTIRVIIENPTDSSYVKSITDTWSNLFGVTILIDPLTSEDFKNALDNKDYQIAIYNITAENERPYSFLSYFLSTNDFFGYNDLEVDTILKSAEQSLTIDDTINMYAKVEKSIIQQNVFVPLYYKKTYLVCANGIDNMEYNPFNNQMDFSYALNYNQED